jgi:hypothetical protein
MPSSPPPSTAPAPGGNTWVAAGEGADDDALVTLNTEPAAPQAADPKRWRALAVTQVAGFMSLLDVSIVNVADVASRARTGADATAARSVAK